MNDDNGWALIWLGITTIAGQQDWGKLLYGLFMFSLGMFGERFLTHKKWRKA